jgi:hypothetical protein
MDDIDRQAMELSRIEAEEKLITASRQYQDAKRVLQHETDEYLRQDYLRQLAEARRDYNEAKKEMDQLSGAQQGQLSQAQVAFLTRRAAGGDTLDAQRMQTYGEGHERALRKGLPVDSAEYFREVEWYVDHQGDGRIPPLNEAEAAKICGISDAEYQRQQQKLFQLKRDGMYRNE